MDDFIASDEEDDGYGGGGYSSVIKDIFGYDKKKYEPLLCEEVYICPLSLFCLFMKK